MKPKLALATIVDSRTDFYQKRKPLVDEELPAIDWLREEFEIIEGVEINSAAKVAAFAQKAAAFQAHSLVIYLPIWADPVLSIQLTNLLPLPVILLGNDRPDTSSLVGILGAGGALDQVGRAHTRIFDHRSPENRKKIRAFTRAASALQELRGQTLGLFGGRSLGIFTAVADPAQIQRLFGVDIEIVDQLEIVNAAEAYPEEEVRNQTDWLQGELSGVQYGDPFTPITFERQVRSYLATRQIVSQHGFSFVGTKCQPELSDGYVTQCVAHMLLNSGLDAGGNQNIVVHACESDADGALTMQILHLLSGGKSAALLDIRWFDAQNGWWILANCGAMPAIFFATDKDSTGLGGIRAEPHVFGSGGGGALSGVATPRQVTLARLCRKNGEYWMAILSGQIEQPQQSDLGRVTPAFPKAFVRLSNSTNFTDRFGSNHIHMVSGDYTEELVSFCRMAGIDWQIWD